MTWLPLLFSKYKNKIILLAATIAAFFSAIFYVTRKAVEETEERIKHGQELAHKDFEIDSLEEAIELDETFDDLGSDELLDELRRQTDSHNTKKNS